MTDVFTKYDWVKTEKNKTGLHGFIELVNKSKPKLIKEENFSANLCKNG